MSSDNPQNTEQPGEFEDFENENAPNQDPASTPAPTPTPTPTPPQPELTKEDQSSQPEGKVDPAKIREEKTKSLQEQLERLQNELISQLTLANTKLQEKFDVAEKQHKVQQEKENAVEIALKAAVRQVAKERDDERKSKKIYRGIMVAAVISFFVLAAHDFLFESTSSPAKPATQSNTAAQPPAPNKSYQYGFMQELDTLLTESDATENQKPPSNNQGEKTQ